MAAGVGFLMLDFARAVISQETHEANEACCPDNSISDLEEWSSLNSLRCGLAPMPGGLQADFPQQILLIELLTTLYGQAGNTTASNIVSPIENFTADALDSISEDR
jgi:hypothetical protein